MTRNVPKAKGHSKARVAAAKENPTLIEVFEKSAAGAQEMAAARLAIEVVSLLGRAIRESGVSQRKLGMTLELSPGAVSQIVNSDGNLRVATIGRYFRALGYQARLFLEPVEADRRVIASRATRSTIAAEFREFVYQSGSWAVASIHLDTPEPSTWESPALSPSAAWHRLALTLDTAQEGQHTGAVT